MLAVMGLLPWTAKITADRLTFEGRELLRLSARQRRHLIGKDIAMIFQEPMSSLNPCFTVAFQLTEALRVHEGLGRKAARERAVELLAKVGIPSPRDRLGAYPHQLSGGMNQRVMIAMAIACNPKLLIADEPTTALDVTIQAQILDLLLDLQRERGMALILITHDMGVVAETVDRVVVQYAGQQVEAQSVNGLFEDAMHPYTAALLAALPERSVGRLLPTIPGVVPGVLDRPSGCLFNPRCVNATEHCRRVQPAFAPGPRGRVRCHYPLTGGVPENHPGTTEAAA
jgi:dipeptide transport system ATP-binding protein